MNLPPIYAAHLPPLGFTPDDAARLAWYWGDLEGQIGGLRSSWGAVVAAALHGGRSGRRVEDLATDHRLDAFEATGKARRLDALFEAVPPDAYRVLERAYGPPSPRDRFDVWGAFAPLAALTPTAVHARETLALVRGLAAEASVREAADTRPEDAEATFWRLAGRLHELRLEKRQGRRRVRETRRSLADRWAAIPTTRAAREASEARLDEALAELHAFRAETTAVRTAQEAALARAQAPHVVLPAVIDALAHADAVTTPDAALAHMLAHGSARKREGKDLPGRARFVTTVGKECGALLVAAEVAFVRAKRRLVPHAA